MPSFDYTRRRVAWQGGLCYHTPMERRVQPKKRYQSASYVTSGAVFYGTLLFSIARVFSLIQLFADAHSRKQLGQAPPEDFTFWGIMGYVFMLALVGLALYLLLQNRQGKLRMKKGNFYLLLNALFALWGIINAVSYFVEMVLFFEFVYLLDFIALITALVVPSVLYQLSDRKQDIPQDNALFASALAATGFSVIATLIVALVLRNSYKDNLFALVRELVFRAGVILFGVGGLLKAIRLRAELPSLVASMPKPEPKPVKKQPEPKPKKPDRKGRIECPDCGKKLAPDVKICPRCGFDIDTPNLFDDDEFDDEPDDDLTEAAEDEFESTFEDEAFAETPVPAEPEREGLPKVVCPRCGKKRPPFLTKCPHCGYYPGDPTEQAEAEAERQRLAAEQAEAERQKAAETTREEASRDLCPRCGKTKPPFLATCPHCGYFPGDPVEEPEPEPEQQTAEPTAPRPAQPKQDPVCENCGKKIPGGLATCPYCGYHPSDAAEEASPTSGQERQAAPVRQSQPDPRCENCGRKIPGGLATCPYCGHYRGETQAPPQNKEVTSLFDEEETNYIFCPHCNNEIVSGTQTCPHCGHPISTHRETGRIRRPTQRLPRVPDPKRLTAKNSIECPECGRRYSAARDVCPYCGFGLYDD